MINDNIQKTNLNEARLIQVIVIRLKLNAIKYTLILIIIHEKVQHFVSSLPQSLRTRGSSTALSTADQFF